MDVITDRRAASLGQYTARDLIRTSELQSLFHFSSWEHCISGPMPHFFALFNRCLKKIYSISSLTGSHSGYPKFTAVWSQEMCTRRERCLYQPDRCMKRAQVVLEGSPLNGVYVGLQSGRICLHWLNLHVSRLMHKIVVRQTDRERELRSTIRSPPLRSHGKPNYLCSPCRIRADRSHVMAAGQSSVGGLTGGFLCCDEITART